MKWHRGPATAPDPSQSMIEFSQFTKPLMTRYVAYVPSAPYESESTSDLDRAWDLCLSLSEEFGYAQVRHEGIILGDYTDGHA